MSNYQKFKQILNPYIKTTIIQRREESSCFSSLFSSCFGSDSSEPESVESVDRLSVDQRAFITGITNVADKLNRGEVVFPGDFTENVSASVQAASDESAPLLRNKNVAQSSASGRPFIDFIPETSNTNVKNNMFRLFLNAVYHYIHELNINDATGYESNRDETINEQKFINDLLTAFERNFDFVAADDLATDDDSHNCIVFVKNSIKKLIPLRTGQINEVREAVYRVGGRPAANAAVDTPASPSAQPEEHGDFGTSFGTSYQAAMPAARSAKK